MSDDEETTRSTENDEVTPKPSPKKKLNKKKMKKKTALVPKQKKRPGREQTGEPVASAASVTAEAHEEVIQAQTTAAAAVCEPRQVAATPVRQVNRKERVAGGVIFYEDEVFSLDDMLVRRIIYREPLLQNAHPRRVVCINFTESHFEKGASSWRHLKNTYYDLLLSVFNALAFATAKKPRVSTAIARTARGQRQPQHRERKEKTASYVSSVAGGDQESEPVTPVAEAPVEADSFIKGGGKDGLQLFVETLVDAKQQTKVKGFRLWIMDSAIAGASDEQNGGDLFTQGLEESLLEAGLIKTMAAQQIANANKSTSQRGGGGPGKAKKGVITNYQLSRDYNFATYNSFESYFSSVIRCYFYADPLLICKNEEDEMAVEEEEAEVEEQQRRRASLQFVDSRKYTNDDLLTVDSRQQDHTKLADPCNVSSLLNKESAMIYHVQADDVSEAQCLLSNYFGPDSVRGNLSGLGGGGGQQTGAYDNIDNLLALCDADDGATVRRRQMLNRFDQTLDAVVPDTIFTGFVNPSITYQLPNMFISPEFIGRMPLPHRVGATLFTVEDQLRYSKEKEKGPEAWTSQSAMHVEREEEEEEDQITPSEDRIQERLNSYSNQHSCLGLHDTTCEVTPEVLFSHQEHLNAGSYVHRARIPESVLQKFKQSKTNEVSARLCLITENLGYKTRLVITATSIDAVAMAGGGGGGSSNRIGFMASDNSAGDNASSLGGQTTSSGAPAQKTPGNSEKIELSAQQTNPLNRYNYEAGARTENTTPLIQLPYLSLSKRGLVRNEDKTQAIDKQLKEYWQKTGQLAQRCDNAAEEERLSAAQKLASGFIGYYKEDLEKWRPFSNSIQSIRAHIANPNVDEVFLKRDVALRMCELNKLGDQKLAEEYYDKKTGQVPVEKEAAFLRNKRAFLEAKMTEAWHAFFNSPNVSIPCLGVRGDLLNQSNNYTTDNILSADSENIAGCGKFIGSLMPVHDFAQELRPYSDFRVWVHSFFSSTCDITYNYKTMAILYSAKFHHCRWYPVCNAPKLNIILSGNGMAGKSKLLQETKKTCPTDIGSMVTHITDQTFNTNRNLNDLFLLYEEFQNKYLGYTGSNNGGNKNGHSGGVGGGVSSGSDKDTVNFFKARLTSGETMTWSMFTNEETGERDVAISRCHCQGNIFGATNNDLSEADANVLSRLILISVAKSRNETEGLRPQDRTKQATGSDERQNKLSYNEHKQLHCVYFLMEFMIKSGVFGDDVFGVQCDGGKEQLKKILDQVQQRYGIQTGDIRKRDEILEMARCMTLSYACWMGMFSPLTRYLWMEPRQPNRPRGLNPRVLLDGIAPFMVICHDQVIDAITSLSSLWIPDHQDAILETFAIKCCKLHELSERFFVQRKKTEHELSMSRSGGNSWLNGLSNSNSNSNSNGGAKKQPTATTYNDRLLTGDYSNGFGAMGGPDGFEQPVTNMETDYNYIALGRKSYIEIAHYLSMGLGELVVSHNDINKLLRDLEKCFLETDSYEMQETVSDDGMIKTRRLVRSSCKEKKFPRKIVDFAYCPVTKRATIAILVAFLKQKLPSHLPDRIIEDLNDDSATTNSGDLTKSNNQTQPTTLSQPHETTTTTQDVLYKKLCDIGHVSTCTETVFTKAIKDVLENDYLERYEPFSSQEEKNREETIERACTNPITGRVPYLSYVVADCPKPIRMTDLFPELTGRVFKESQNKVLFVDKLLMLDLQRRPEGRPFIINNFNTVDPSVRLSMSIHHSQDEYLSTRHVEKYKTTSAWTQDRDIDAVSCRKHLNNLAFPGLATAPDTFLINYPPLLYRELARLRTEKHKRLTNGDTTKELTTYEYPFTDVAKRIFDRKKKIEGEYHGTAMKYSLYSSFMDADYSKNGIIRKRPNHEHKRKLEEVLVPFQGMMEKKRKLFVDIIASDAQQQQ